MRLIQNAMLATGLFSFLLPVAALADEACDAVINARYAQYSQPRVLRDTVYTMNDGRQKKDTIILTQSMIYAEQEGIWRAGQINSRQRTASSPALIKRNLEASNCQQTGHADENGQPTTVYTYSSGAEGTEVTLAIWVADATGLPVRAEMRAAQPRGNQAAVISARYAYNDAVSVPARANMADIERRDTFYRMIQRLQFGKATY